MTSEFPLLKGESQNNLQSKKQSNLQLLGFQAN